MENMLEWLQNWYLSNCDGNWEHSYGIKITTLDNPGWDIMIELEGTNVELKDEKWLFFEKSANDWYGYKVENNVFVASGDPQKLEFLISLFRNKVVHGGHGSE